jgi:hypothetical protein
MPRLVLSCFNPLGEGRFTRLVILLWPSGLSLRHMSRRTFCFLLLCTSNQPQRVQQFMSSKTTEFTPDEWCEEVFGQKCSTVIGNSAGELMRRVLSAKTFKHYCQWIDWSESRSQSYRLLHSTGIWAQLWSDKSARSPHLHDCHSSQQRPVVNTGIGHGTLLRDVPSSCLPGQLLLAKWRPPMGALRRVGQCKSNSRPGFHEVWFNEKSCFSPKAPKYTKAVCEYYGCVSCCTPEMVGVVLKAGKASNLTKSLRYVGGGTCPAGTLRRRGPAGRSASTCFTTRPRTEGGT